MRFRRLVISEAAGASVLILLLFCAPASQPRPTAAATASIDQNDCGTGDVTINPEWDLNLWYAWVNTGVTRVVYLATYSAAYPSPTITFLGERYTSKVGTDQFVAHIFLMLESYNDTNGNFVPDADFSASPPVSEIEYAIYANASRGFEATEVTKNSIGNITHYVWSIAYLDVQALMVTVTERWVGNSTHGGMAPPGCCDGDLFIERLGFGFDYYVEGDSSYLKSQVEIGNATLEPRTFVGDEYVATIENRSLSAIYATAISSTANSHIEVNNHVYDSRLAPSAPDLTTRSEILTSSTPVYQMLFGSNYSWHAPGSDMVVPSVAAASGLSSFPLNTGMWWSGHFNLVQSYLNSLSGFGIPLGITIDPTVSPLLYRVCYPHWSGYGITHDPTFRAFIGAPVVVVAVFLVAVCGILLLVGALVLRKRTRRFLREYRMTSMTGETETTDAEASA